MASLTLQLYQLEQWANQWVSGQLSSLSVMSVGIIFLAGLLTSLTPCTLSMLPITVGYIAGYATKQNSSVLRQSLWFALGLATTLTLLGMIAAVAGRIYGQVGWGLTIVVSLVAIAMGLNLLNALPLSFPRSRFLEELPDRVPAGLQAYTLGATFGLVAAPCSTPVLATLLAWVATTQKLVVGAGLLLAYTTGYVAPLILVGVFSGALQKLLALRQWSSWITPVSGVLLIAFGVIALAIRL
ncbi:cytochrome c biogenesis protein CcdA [Thermosynechococcus sp. QKsg1]|uniref:cytochrome c biogenesis protein CcdA n=1 Tax=unclassified Thermosynechococcus TaxID=2622553 RepID=UPI00122DDAD1|nr:MULTISPECIES: cytochrome c biogenesis protein CcdA [unclassified Thermosynechococcus]QEQ02289.1 cytochrome c biogenesis protein CcdA [Thermosynechococcus sp. CL-1]WJI25385.1 cytochrome c biogenesis protein CcdA [Thermosynechococcus sp. B0]WJI27918.1 cytochrome c biogenesis protein CcdA [Thermosynechococcus sp. B1]WJI30444.1 cytochrome c biogenesis protein CcdA [Thermosynechococcus sp. B3]WKT85042.1 cytochrome c biogenesis protein CcdA [Thermosynechococcus sp. HY596]